MFFFYLVVSFLFYLFISACVFFCSVSDAGAPCPLCDGPASGGHSGNHVDSRVPNGHVPNGFVTSGPLCNGVAGRGGTANGGVGTDGACNGVIGNGTPAQSRLPSSPYDNLACQYAYLFCLILIILPITCFVLFLLTVLFWVFFFVFLSFTIMLPSDMFMCSGASAPSSSHIVCRVILCISYTPPLPPYQSRTIRITDNGFRSASSSSPLV